MITARLSNSSSASLHYGRHATQTHCAVRWQCLESAGVAYLRLAILQCMDILRYRVCLFQPLTLCDFAFNHRFSRPPDERRGSPKQCFALHRLDAFPILSNCTAFCNHSWRSWWHFLLPAWRAVVFFKDRLTNIFTFCWPKKRATERRKFWPVCQSVCLSVDSATRPKVRKVLEQEVFMCERFTNYKIWQQTSCLSTLLNKKKTLGILEAKRWQITDTTVFF